MLSKDILTQILYARSGYEIAIEVIVVGPEKLVEKAGHLLVEATFKYYVKADRQMAGEHAKVDAEHMELYYPGMNGRLQIFDGPTVGYFNEKIRMEIELEAKPTINT